MGRRRVWMRMAASSCFTRSRSKTQSASLINFVASRRRSPASRFHFVDFGPCLLCAQSTRLTCSALRMSSSMDIETATESSTSPCTTTTRIPLTSPMISWLLGMIIERLQAIASMPAYQPISTLLPWLGRCFMYGKVITISLHGGATSTNSMPMKGNGICWFGASFLTLEETVAFS